MQIDWFTFAAQIVNFLILVWLLKRFLYGPIVNAMAEREEHIAEQFASAREREETAETEAAKYREKQEELEALREDRIEDAEREAHERRNELIEEARDEVHGLEEQWREALRRERETFLQELSHRASRETIALARRALQDLAHADLEAEVIRVFTERMRSLDEDRQQVLVEAVEANPGDVTVHTAFELDTDQKEALTDTLKGITGTDPAPDFERDEGVGLGIELRVGGHKIAWSLDSYISDLRDRIRARLDAAIGKGEAPSSPEQEEVDLSASSPNSRSEAP